jgi:hypothetical protein
MDMDKHIRIGHVITSYYKQLNRDDLTENDFHEWIESLQEPMKSAFKNKGLDECRGVLNFQRFILELQDKGLQEYLKDRLTEEEFNYWKAHTAISPTS